jgi:hypothetical protein
LTTLAETTRFKTDKRRLRRLADLLAELALYCTERDYGERESKYARVTLGLEALLRELEEAPTKVSAEHAIFLAESVREQLEREHREYLSSSQPFLEIQNVLNNDYYIPDRNGQIAVQLAIDSRAGGAPVEAVDLSALEEDGLRQVEPGHSASVLRAGERREVQLTIRPSGEQLRERAFTLRVALSFRTRMGERVNGGTYSFPLRIGDPADFEPLENPYERYSGGHVVDDASMFFGREELLERITRQVTTGPLGQCFVLYGQKRSGKTSVLEQLQRRVGAPHLTVMFSVGTVDIGSATAGSFASRCLDEVRERLESLGDIQRVEWPSVDDVRDSPIRALRQAFKGALEHLRRMHGVRDARIVLLVDEFTYLFEYIREGMVPATFMRQWKALLEERIFSAVLVGQDSMPRFKSEFPNEFGVTFDERLSYLSRDQATALAERPILLRGESRYRGRALDRLLDLTAGNPFYMQIVCDRLVRHLNARKAPFVTEADVDMVADSLTRGSERLAIERFDPLITAAGESVAEASREEYLGLLTALAKRSIDKTGATAGELGLSPRQLTLLEDLRVREVVDIDQAGRATIRVGLCSSWLRENC